MANQLEVGALVRSAKHAYRLERELGRGGFATTFLAVREGDERRVALKSLHFSRLAEWKSMELFERETAVLGRLSHPRIPDYIDDFALGEDPDAPSGLVLVQEYVDGFPLSDVVRGARSMDEAAMLSWLLQMLEVLDYLHHLAPPVIHRDITPKNILLRADGTAYLVDFGSVQAALRSATTVASTSAGTFGYAPMEQFVSAAFPASDMYGLAMTFLAVAAGREPSDMPFSGVRVDVRKLVDLDARLTLLMERMTEPDPERRLGEARIAIEQLRPLAMRHSAATQALAEVYRSERAPATRVEVASDDLLPSERLREAGRRLDSLAGESLSLPPLAEALSDLSSSTISGNGSLLGVDSYLIDVAEMAVVATLPRSQRVLAMTPSAEVLIAYHEDSWNRDQLSVFERRDGAYEKGHAIQVEGDGMTAISPDGTSFARINNGAILIYDIRQGSLTQRLEGEYRSVRYSADGQVLGAFDNRRDRAHLWYADGREATIDKVREFAFAPDGRMAACMRGHEVFFGTLDELIAGRGTSARGGGDFTWHHPCFSPDGRWLAALDYSADKVLVISVDERRRVLTLGSPGRPKNRVSSVSFVGFAADGARLLVGCDVHYNRFSPEDDDCVAIWSLPEGRYLGAVMRARESGPPVAVAASGHYGLLPGKLADKRDKGRAPRMVEGPWHRPDVATRALVGERIDQALDDKARAQLADIEERWAYFQDLMADGSVDAEANLLAMLDASRGLSHVLDLVKRRAREAQSQSTVFGGQRQAAALTGDQIVAAARELSARPGPELGLLHEELLAEAERAEAERAAALARAAAPRSKALVPGKPGKRATPARAAAEESGALAVRSAQRTTLILTVAAVLLALLGALTLVL